MADLKLFLGELVSGISNSRIHSDLQTIRIAEAYAKDKMLQNFAVPRMRIDQVRAKIPIAIQEAQTKSVQTYRSLDVERVSMGVNELVMKSLEKYKIPKDKSQMMISFIKYKTSAISKQLSSEKNDALVKGFVEEINKDLTIHIPIWYKESNKRGVTEARIVANQKIFEKEATDYLRKEVDSAEFTESISSLEVIVEASKLREISPENIIMLDVTITEQGMEMIKMEDANGDEVTKLMPE
jgi:hypothetical protein